MERKGRVMGSGTRNTGRVETEWLAGLVVVGLLLTSSNGRDWTVCGIVLLGAVDGWNLELDDTDIGRCLPDGWMGLDRDCGCAVCGLDGRLDAGLDSTG